MKVKSGDIIDFLAISWNAPHWEFDHPTVILKPCIIYSPDGMSCEEILEDVSTNFCIDMDIVDDDIIPEFEANGWKLSTLRKVAKNRLSGGDMWKTKIQEVIFQKIKFYTDDDGDLSCIVIEEKRV